MAGNKSSGNVLPFKMDVNTLEKAVNQYKTDMNDGKFCRASWPHFCAYLGYTEQEVQEVIERGEDVKSAYHDRNIVLKRMLTWIRGEMLSGTGWSGQNQTKAIFALQQDYGDGTKYANNHMNRDKGPGKVVFNVSFGDGDARGRKAAK